MDFENKILKAKNYRKVTRNNNIPVCKFIKL